MWPEARFKTRPTLSTFILLKAAWRTLKLCIYSCSSLAWNLTFFRRMQPGNSMSMNWQYAAPAKHKTTEVTSMARPPSGFPGLGCEPSTYLNRAARSLCRWDAKNRWPTPACHAGSGCQRTQTLSTHSLPSPTWRTQHKRTTEIGFAWKCCGMAL